MPRISKPARDSYTRIRSNWHEAKEPQKVLWPLVDLIRERQEYVFRRFRRAIEAYENVDCPNLDAYRFIVAENSSPPFGFNIIESTVDTLHAEIIANQTKSQAITENGDWLKREQAEDITHFLKGVHLETNLQEKVRPRVVRDAIALGHGVYKYYQDQNGRIAIARCFPWEVIVDESECCDDNEPQNTYHEYLVPRAKLLASKEFRNKPAMKALIKEAQAFQFKSGGAARDTRVSDVVLVREAWHTPSDNEADDGAYVKCLQNGTLAESEWDYKCAPFVHVRFRERTRGFYGKGVAEMMREGQEHLHNLREQMKLNLAGSSPFIWCKNGSKLTEAEISNATYRVIESDVMPQHMIYNSVPQDMVQRFETEKSDAPNLVGVNMAMMKSEMPSGIDGASGKAQLVYNDTKSKRFMQLAREDEASIIALSEGVIHLADRIVDDGDPYEIRGKNDGWMQTLDYANIRLDSNEFILQLAPANLLSDSIAARFREVEALMSFAPEQLKPHIFSLLQAPDTEAVTNLIDADSRILKKVFSLMLRGKKKAGQVAPQPFFNLQEAVNMGRSTYLDALAAGAPEDRLKQVRDWLAQAQYMIDANVAAQKAALPAPGMGPSQMPPQGAQMPMQGAPQAAPGPDAALALQGMNGTMTGGMQ